MVNTNVSQNCVENICIRPWAFMMLYFAPLNIKAHYYFKVLVFFYKRLVHVMQWSPAMDYQALLKQQCHVR